MGVVRTTYVIDEEGKIIYANDKVKAKEDPQKNAWGSIMNIIISPTKKMRYVENNLEITESELLEDTLEILSWLKERTYSELKTIWQCNDKIAEQNYERIKSMELDKRVTPAILAYDGIVFKTIEPEKFSPKEIEYLSDKLKILSGFYGVLSPTDGVVPYRLEMQSKVNIFRI